MDLKRFQYILKVYETGSITRAAGNLFISQPALSHYIAKVEEDLGAQIFDRSTNPLSLTQTGEIYIDAARQILAIHERMHLDIQKILRNEGGKICVSMSHVRASYFLPCVLPEFQKKYPDVEIVPVEYGYEQGEKMVMCGANNISVMPRSVVSTNLPGKRILREELKLVSGTELPCKGMRSDEKGNEYPWVDVHFLNQCEMIMLKNGHGLRKTLDIIFMEHGVTPEIALETNGSEIAYRLAASGMGVTIVPESTIRMVQTKCQPFIYSVGENGIYWDIVAVYRNWERMGKPQRDFIHMLQNCFKNG